MRRHQAQQAADASWLATHGYAVAAIDYRLGSEALFPAQIDDVKAAVRWLRTHAGHYGLDPSRFGAWGASSGGHLAALAGLTGAVAALGDDGAPAEPPSGVRAVVDFFGPTDFLQMDAHAPPDAPFSHDAPTSPESRLVGGPIREHPGRVARANPVTYVTPAAPPFLIVHGEADPLVPWHQSQILYDALRAADVPVTFYRIAGAGHGGAAFASPMIRGAVRAFFDAHLGPPVPNR
jgi:acetyl esterase/lipase